MTKRHAFAVLVVFAAMCPASSAAQVTTGSLIGTVTDPGGVVPGANVTITEVNRGTSDTFVTDSAGTYTAPFLTPGTYRVEVNVSGFKKWVREGIILQVNQRARVDVLLEIGRLEETTTVVASTPLLRTDSSEVGTVIEERAIKELPLNGRNFATLVYLTPGITPGQAGENLSGASTFNPRGASNFNALGHQANANGWLIDGIDNNEYTFNTLIIAPSVEQVREFKVLSGVFSAEFGRGAGVVSVATKSGTNTFHGTVFEYLRNDAFDARNFFVPAGEPKPKYIRNQFGGALGGPINRDRTFFFADYEGTRSREGITRLTNVPTALERAGNFSERRFGRPTNPFTGMPFDNDTIPDFFINPVGRAIAALYPLPNRNDPVQNFVSSPILHDDNDSFDARVDHHLNSAAQLTFRYSFGDRDLFEPFTGSSFSLVPGFGDTVRRRSQNAMAALTWILTPNLVNESRVALSRVAGSVTQEASVLNSDVGLPTISPRERDLGLSFITITGFSPLGDEGNNPQHSVTNVYQFLNNSSYVRGNHLIKFGADLRFSQQNAFRDVESRGRLQFSPFLTLTNNALADLLLGFPLVTSVARVDNPQQIRTESYNFFVNDSYRVTPRLTLTGGLRYEYNSPPVDAEDRANVYDVATRNLVPVGTNGVPRSGFDADKNNFAPRVGFAWTLGDDGATVLRGGYGIYYDQSALAPAEALYFNSPFFDNNIFFPLPGLPLTVDNPFPAFFPFALPDSALAIQRDLRTGYMQHWNFNVERQVGSKGVFEVAYVGSKGTKLLTARDINQPQPSVLPPGLPFVPRPDFRFDDIDLLESRANSNYNALQARFQQRLSRGFTALASYTWSKSIDDASNFFSSTGDPNFPQNSYNVAAERGRSNFDVRHRLSVSYSYALPFGKGLEGWTSTLLSGWETNGIVTLQSGRPFTVALLSEIDNSGTGRSILGFGANDRPNLVGNPELSSRTPERWFNTAAFAFPAPGTFGNAGRNILDGPGFQNVNASLVKNTALSERFNLQFRAEAFNLFNHPNFNLPDNFFPSPSFGRISSARDPRHIQFGLKLLF